jgi:hypothetical protein
MNFQTSPFRPLVAALAGAAMLASATLTGAEAAAYVVAEAEYEPLPTGEEVQVAAADCYSIGQRIASQEGGQLHSANARSQGGQQVCVVVVVIPAKNGQRARRIEVVVPAG